MSHGRRTLTDILLAKGGEEHEWTPAGEGKTYTRWPWAEMRQWDYIVLDPVYAGDYWNTVRTPGDERDYWDRAAVAATRWGQRNGVTFVRRAYHDGLVIYREPLPVRGGRHTVENDPIQEAEADVLRHKSRVQELEAELAATRRYLAEAEAALEIKRKHEAERQVVALEGPLSYRYLKLQAEGASVEELNEEIRTYAAMTMSERKLYDKQYAK